MQPKDRLEPQPWMTTPETVAVMAALAAAGGEARFVGGCVRDTLLGRKVSDVDIATQEPPERVMNLLARAGIKAIPTGITHGTVTAVIGSKHFEITTLRRDVESYGRHAKVEYTDDWQADAARRDFTINALFCGIDGALYDPFGGLDDLRTRRVRFVGDPEARIREDVLRLLRFFRFHAHYGNSAPDPAALAACSRLAPLLPTLSGERVCGETLKLVIAPEPAGVVELMRETGVLAHFLPEATRVDRLRAMVTIEATLTRHMARRADPIRRLAALLDGNERSAVAVATRLRFSNAERDRLVGLADDAELSSDLPAPARRRLIYRYGRDRYCDLVLLRWAEAMTRGAAADPQANDSWLGLLRAGAEWNAPRFPLKGRDAVRLGVPPGPAVGRLMATIEDWWIAGDFQADRSTCLAKLQDLVPTAT
jgi:poly(A) polymerase